MAAKNNSIESIRDTKNELNNEDPISGEGGAHPVGTGVGAALGGAATGAVAGLAGGPIGTVVGTIVGGVAGAYAGKAVAENIDPTVEAAYWETEYVKRPYYNNQHGFDEYAPAYRVGWEAYDPAMPEDWMSRQELARERWENEGGHTAMSWEEAQPAAEEAYCRVQQNGSKHRKAE